jgi:MSHA biogenesis protein MshP
MKRAMNRSVNRILCLRRQAGVGILTAIFLLVVLAALGVAMVGIYTAQQASANVDLLGAQAYQSARAGLEWGIFQRLRSGACTDANTAANPFTASFRMPAGSSLAAFTVNVSCTVSGTGPLARALIRSDACNMPDAAGKCVDVNNAESVRRTLEAEL